MKPESVSVRVHLWFKIFFATAAFAFVAVMLHAADPLSETLQKGLFEEEANHNLDAAIKAYQAVIDQSQEHRRIAATALFRLGECYRKLNKTNDAAGYYQRLLREFPDQSTLATLSKQNLSALGLARSESESTTAPATSQEEAEVQRIRAMIKDSPDLINARDQGGGTPLHTTAANGYLNVVRFLLANGADINARNNQSATPLHLAAAKGHKAVCEFLLTSGADVNARGAYHVYGTPLHQAVRNGYQAVCQVLLQQKADPNALGSDTLSTPGTTDQSRQTPLHLAAKYGTPALAQLLIKHGANVNATDSIQNLPLHQAAQRGSLEMTKLLVEHKSRIDARDKDRNLPLHLAVTFGSPDVIRFLVQNGSDVNARGRGGRTAAHLAAEKKNEEVLRTVLEFKPDLEIKDDMGLTPLFVAVVQKIPSATQVLLEAGASPNVTQSGRFQTPLILAILEQQREIATLLLDHKADPNLPGPDGTVPTAHARSQISRYAGDTAKFFQDMYSLLVERGADPNVDRRKNISVTRQGELPLNFFERDYGGNNQYTLFELIAFYYQGRREGWSNWKLLAFPDLTQLTVERLVDEGKGTNRIAVNLEQRLAACEDLPLEFGDVVIIPEKDHRLNETWRGLTNQIAAALIKCTERTVVLLVKNQQLRVKLNPVLGLPQDRSNLPISSVDGVQVLHWYSLQYVVRNSGALRASSDLTRIKVIRREGDANKSRILLFNLERSRSEDLWLQDGDLIEIPDKES